MRFALVTADSAHKVTWRAFDENGDGTSFMQWVGIFGGLHLSFSALRSEGYDILKNFEVVMMSGHPNYMTDIISIGKFLKDSKTISMFYPEGSIQLYDNSINGYHAEYFEAMRACDIVSYAEEDKKSYYESMITKDSIARFIHVPMTPNMSSSSYFLPRDKKEMYSVVYGDNNPNHPLVALSALNRIGHFYPSLSIKGVELREADINRLFPDIKMERFPKLTLREYLLMISASIFNIYPTEWIGTARQQIACACAGTPCIGSRESHTQQRLFPRLACGIYDVQTMCGMATELIENKGFYEDVVSYAREKMNFYDFGSTMSRFLGAVNDANRLFKKEMVSV